MFKKLFSWRRSIGALAVAGALVGVGYAPFQTLRARLPDPLNQNPHITVLTDARPQPGTVLAVLRPSLQILGVVEAIEPVGESESELGARTDYALRVSLFPAGQALIRDDAEFSLRETTPDLLEIVTTYLTAERREALAAESKQWYDRHQFAISASFERLKELMDLHLGLDALGQSLQRDPEVRGIVQHTLEAEVFHKIDWDRATRQALRSDAANTAVELLSEAGAFGAGWTWLKEGYRSRWNGIWSDEPFAGPDDMHGVFKPLNIFVPRWDNARSAAVGRIGRDVEAAYPKYRKELQKGSTELAYRLVKEEQVERKGLAAAKSLATNRELRAYLLKAHGPEALKRVQAYLAAVSQDQELARRARDTVDSGLELVAAMLRDLLLDESRDGPNPLVIAFVRARLLRKTAPVLIVDIPGVGEPVRPGQVFVSRTR